jgi:hypothetical protein
VKRAARGRPFRCCCLRDSSVQAPSPTCSTRIISWSSWDRMWQCQT